MHAAYGVSNPQIDEDYYMKSYVNTDFIIIVHCLQVTRVVRVHHLGSHHFFIALDCDRKSQSKKHSYCYAMTGVLVKLIYTLIIMG